MNENHRWEFDQEKLCGKATGFYANLYNSNPELGGDFVRGYFSQLDTGVLRSLEATCTDDEIYTTLIIWTPWKLQD